MEYQTTIWQEYQDEETEETYEAEVKVVVEFDEPDPSVGYGGYFEVVSANFTHTGEEATLSFDERSRLEAEAEAYAKDPEALDGPIYND